MLPAPTALIQSAAGYVIFKHPRLGTTPSTAEDRDMNEVIFFELRHFTTFKKAFKSESPNKN
ncbi:hypothetical protein VH1709_contig00011-0023 [Vibrio harveyi]|nr:hypothetical protein VH1709_contig00011-0023 [Vibrio harveyi]